MQGTRSPRQSRAPGHASYIVSWLAVPRNGKRAIFTAGEGAQNGGARTAGPSLSPRRHDPAWMANLYEVRNAALWPNCRDFATACNSFLEGYRILTEAPAARELIRARFRNQSRSRLRQPRNSKARHKGRAVREIS